MAKTKRRHSLRNRLIGYNLTLMISVLVLCGMIFIVSVGMIVGSYVQADIDFLLTATADSMESGISYCSEVVTKVRKSDVLMEYLPKQLTKDELEAIVKEIIEQLGASSIKDMGKVMAEAKAKTVGRADGRMINEIAKGLLS